MNLIIMIMDIIGTVAFAVSGAMTAMHRKMDIFGVAVLGLTTAVGGGCIRDLLLGIHPPAMLKDPEYTLLAIAASVITFIIGNRSDIMEQSSTIDRIMLVSDSMGLASFTVYGVSVAYGQGEKGLFLVVFVAVITGVGGGVLRDLFAGNTPFIFVKHVYAVASIIGALVCAILWDILSPSASMVIGMLLIFSIRMLAAHYHWNLPTAGGHTGEK